MRPRNDSTELTLKLILEPVKTAIANMQILASVRCFNSNFGGRIKISLLNAVLVMAILCTVCSPSLALVLDILESASLEL